MKSINEFRASLKRLNRPPEDLPDLLQALWWEAKGDWDLAHKITQDISGPAAAWVHAYLHRKEGDIGNASYWYSRSGKPKATGSHDAEWNEIVNALLTKEKV